MKRILIISPQPFYVDRGTPINVRAIVTRLSELGYEAHLLTLPHGKDVTIPGVQIHRCLKLPFVETVRIGLSWPKLIYDIMLFFQALYLAFSKKFFVVHGIEDGAIIGGTVGMLTGLPLVFDMDSCMVTGIRDTWLGRMPGLLWMIERVEEFFLRRAVVVVTVADSLTRKVTQLSEAIPVFQINDFPVGCDEEPSRTAIEALRARYGAGSAAVYVYTGNLEFYQGIELLVDSFSALVQRRSDLLSNNVKLIIVGGSAEQVSVYEKRAKERGAGESIVFTGARPIAEMPLYLSLADVLVSPRIIGRNTPLKIYSYMASGKPVVCTAIESHTAVLSEESAFLALPTVEEFSFALGAAGIEREEAVRRAANAKSIVEENYSERRFKEKLGEVYTFVEDATKGKPRAASAMNG
jgi:glycosyltransferase involved in cell wall biosynthesis